MIERLNKAIYLAAGIGLVAKEKLEKAVHDLATELGLSSESAKKMLTQLKQRHEDFQRALSEKIAATSAETVARLNLASKDELTKLDERLTALELEVVRLTGHAHGARSTKG